MPHSLQAGSTAQLTRRARPALSRWLWLVKKFLAIPALRWTWRVGFYVYTALGTDRFNLVVKGLKPSPVTAGMTAAHTRTAAYPNAGV